MIKTLKTQQPLKYESLTLKQLLFLKMFCTLALNELEETQIGISTILSWIFSFYLQKVWLKLIKKWRFKNS